jgi:hypothetical protein
MQPAAVAVEDQGMMTSPAAPRFPHALADAWQRPVWLALGGFATFLAGAGAVMAGVGVFDPLLLALAALINVVLMLGICAFTSAALELNARPERAAVPWRVRVGQRTLRLAAMYWTAAGLAFLLSPLLARI